MTRLPPPRDEAAERAAFVELYGEDLWNEIQALAKPKPLSAREVMKPRRLPTEDRPALQTEDSEDPRWWDK
jgi:hypothetical protein